MSADQDKFRKQDLPKIMEALERARKEGAKATVTVQFGADGGVLGILYEPKIFYK